MLIILILLISLSDNCFINLETGVCILLAKFYIGNQSSYYNSYNNVRVWFCIHSGKDPIALVVWFQTLYGMNTYTVFQKKATLDFPGVDLNSQKGENSQC